VANRFPFFDLSIKKLINLDQRINLCRTEQQKAPALQPESRELLALSAYIGRQSRGLPIDIAVPEPAKPFLESGRAAFNRRQGQLNLSCTQCHDGLAGNKLAGNPIPQAHPTGYPIYRLEWQGLGSLQRRLRNCMIGVRAEPYANGAPEFVELEYYLMWRARGMKLETPAVRP
jgi:sulfur-oxidizing protein SoxA